MYYIENEYGKMRILTHENSDFAKKAFCYTSKLGVYEFGKMILDNMSGIDEYILIVTLSGSGVVNIGNTSVKALPDSVTIIPPNTDYSYRTSIDCYEWNHYLIQVGGSAVQPLFDTIIKNKKYTFNIHYAVNSITTIVDNILDFDFSNPSEFEEECSVELYRIVHLIYKGYINRIPSADSLSQITQIILKYVKNHYREVITLDDLSRRCYVSSAHLIRVFRDEIGLTPYNYLKQYRIDRSKELLRYTVLSIKEIAVLVGFSNASNFIKQFKSIEKVTPDFYRSTAIQTNL